MERDCGGDVVVVTDEQYLAFLGRRLLGSRKAHWW
jgi:hypothetical protein